MFNKCHIFWYPHRNKRLPLLSATPLNVAVIRTPSQKSKRRFIQEKARFNRDEYNFNGINRDLSEILS